MGVGGGSWVLKVGLSSLLWYVWYLGKLEACSTPWALTPSAIPVTARLSTWWSGSAYYPPGGTVAKREGCCYGGGGYSLWNNVWTGFWVIKGYTKRKLKSIEMIGVIRISLMHIMHVSLILCQIFVYQSGKHHCYFFELCFWPPGESESKILSLLVLFWSLPTPEGHICLFQLWNAAHQWVDSFIYLIFWCWAGTSLWEFREFLSKTAACFGQEQPEQCNTDLINSTCSVFFYVKHF